MDGRTILETCNICNEPKLIKEGTYRIAVDCACIRKERVELKLKKFNKLSITNRNNSNDIFDNADREADEDVKNMNKFKNYASNFDKIIEKNAGLLMIGNPGTGKTFFANCIANDIQKTGYTVLSFNLSGYFRKVQETYQKDSRLTEDVLLQAVTETDLLFIDDLGSEKITEWGHEKLYNLIDTRYKAAKPIIITTNFNFKELKGVLQDKLIDRLKEMTTAVIFDGESKREKKNVDVWELLKDVG